MGFTVDSRGKPSYNDEADPQSDLQGAADWADQVGGLLKVTAAERELLTAGQTSVGWLIVETDTGRIYKRTASSPQGELIVWDTGWIDLTPAGSFGDLDGVSTAYRIINGTVHVRVSALGALPNNGLTFVASGLPAAARPAATTGIVRGGAVMGTGGYSAGVTIYPTGHASAGQIAIANFSGAERQWASAMISYPLG